MTARTDAGPGRIIRFDDDGLAHEHWGVLDLMAMMQQLGAVPDGPPGG